jgi:poly-gamma-glutamate capsule biosynthesis protein CapA/YwtB (metallophosphatase superfamily)
MSDAQRGGINLVGDVMIETPTVRSRRSQVPAFDEALIALASGDLAIMNLEMPLSNRGYRVPKHSNLRSAPEIIDDIVAMGVDAVSLANNHMMDYGPEALLDTIEVCERVNLPACGAGKDLDAAMAPLILESPSGRVGFLSVASTLPVESDAGAGKPGIAPIRVGFSFEIDSKLLVEQPGTMPIVHSWANPDDQERVCETIRDLRQQVDTVIVAIHWGVPPYWLSPHQGLLAEYQQPLGHALIDAGADVICGHHAHVLHPIEIYKGRPIFYSLGNFVFEQPRGFMEPESVIARIIPDDPMTIELTPIWVDDEGFALLATGACADAVLSKLEGLSTAFGTCFARSGDRARIVIDA